MIQVHMQHPVSPLVQNLSARQIVVRDRVDIHPPWADFWEAWCVCIVLTSVAALPPPGFETLSMVDLLRYQADHLDFCCVSTTVYLDLVLLCICRCVSAVVYPPLCICHCVYCVVYPLLYLLLFIYHCVSAAVYIVLCILNYFCISAAVNMYPDLVLYIWLYICHCIYLPWCICHCVCCVVYPLLYLPLCICRCVSAAVYLPLYILHCISATVSAVLLRVIEYKERLN